MGNIPGIPSGGGSYYIPPDSSKLKKTGAADNLDLGALPENLRREILDELPKVAGGGSFSPALLARIKQLPNGEKIISVLDGITTSMHAALQNVKNWEEALEEAKAAFPPTPGGVAQCEEGLRNARLALSTVQHDSYLKIDRL